MRKLKENVSLVLGNENGGPNVEQVMGIAVALAVGAGLFVFGTAVYDWFNGSAGKTVGDIKTPGGNEFVLHYTGGAGGAGGSAT